LRVVAGSMVRVADRTRRPAGPPLARWLRAGQWVARKGGCALAPCCVTVSMLDELMGCMAPCFARVEPRRQARKYVTGLISDVPRKNCWALAEQAGDVTPDKMQRLLERAAWDAYAAMRAVRAFAVARLGDPGGAVLVLDESGQEKAGEHTAGVKRQYLGCAGRVANGINVVYASYVAPAGHAVIEARLHVPKNWAEDRERRRARASPRTWSSRPSRLSPPRSSNNSSPRDAARRG
jgi:SRSO17 transposase